MKLTVLAVFYFLGVAQANKLPSFFKKCNRKDPNFLQCLTEATQRGLSEITHPIPEINLPRVDPLEIQELKIPAEGHKVVSLEQDFTNCKLYGISKSNITKVVVDFEKKFVDFIAVIPQVIKNCHYKLNGKVLVLPVVGEGSSKVVLDNVHVNLYLEYEEIKTKKGKTHIKFVKNKLDFLPDHCSIHFDNLFDGQKNLGDNINKILNENWKDVYADVESGYERGLGVILQSILNQFFAKLTVEECFD